MKKKIDNWIKQIEVCCRVQIIVVKGAKVQLVTLWLGGITLIWWDSKVQEDLRMKCKMTSSWHDFTATLKKQFYLLGYMQQALMNW